MRTVRTPVTSAQHREDGVAGITSVAVVTGAGRGLGKSIAERFARRGHHVVVTDIDEAAARATADAIGGTGLAQDVRDPDSHRGVAEAAAARGRLAHVDTHGGMYTP
nr:SDR family NAD(P)-dependent oxidoreductase [Deltaproteobacteria bacterium]